MVAANLAIAGIMSAAPGAGSDAEKQVILIGLLGR